MTQTGDVTRRAFIGATAAAAAAAALPGAAAEAGGRARIRVGACVVGLAAAKQAGLDGVEVGVGGEADELDIAKAPTRARYKAQMAETGLPIASLMMGLLNDFPLATDPRAPAWLTQSIDAAKDLGAKTILVAFFGNGDLLADKGLKEEEFRAAAQRIRAAAPRARDAGVTLAIENYLSAEQNLRLLEAIGDDSVRIYYDVYNTGKSKRYDSPAEIRLLKDRIAQFHYKNGSEYLDQDKAYFEAISAAVRETRFQGWIVLETSNPSKDAVADARRNGEFVRALLA